MLWYKGWLETRLRLVFALGVVGFLLLQNHSLHFAMSGRGRQSAILTVIGFMIPAAVASIGAMLAGAGISTQPAFQATKGIHGSTLFTLSLPVSRLRLVAVRALIGWLQTIGVTAALCGGIWLVTPVVRASATWTEIFAYSATVVVCGSAVYFLSVLLGTVLDDQWRVWGTLIATGALGWLTSRGALPEWADLFRAMGKDSPIVAHATPWAPMGFAAGLSVAFFFAAWRVAQAREY